jgi:hypothetical protein
VQDVGTTLLEPKLLCGLVWRGAARDRQTIRGKAERGFLPALKDGVSAREIR